MNRSPIQRPDAVAHSAESARRIRRVRRSLRILSPALTALLLLPMAAQAASSDPPTTSSGTHASAARGDASGSSTREHPKQADAKKADAKKKKGNKKHRRVTSSFRAMAGETRVASATSVAAPVNAAPVLTVTAVDVTSVYGDYPVTYTLKVDGLKAGADVAAVTRLLKITGPDPASDSGNYPIDVSGATPAGYGGIQFVRGWHLIKPAPLQVRTADVTTTYGQQPKFETKFYGLRNGDTAPKGISAPVAVKVPGVGYEPVAIDASTDAGTYHVYVDFDDRNYQETGAGATWTVNKAPLVVGVDSPTMVWGDKVPAFRTTAIGLVNGETVAALTPIAVDGPNPLRPIAGSHRLVPSGGVSPNYATKYVSGTLTVAKRPVWVSVDDQTKVYGSPNPKFTVTVTGMPAGMTLPMSVQGPQPELAPGKYPLTPLPPITGNIEFKELRAGTLTTVPAPLTITPADKAIPSGSVPSDFGWRSSGWVYDHTDTRLTVKPTCGAVIDGTAVSAATRPGVYQDAIRCSSAVVPIGYTVTYAKAALTVNPLVTLRATGLPTSIVPKATVDGAEVSLPRTGVEVAFGSEHRYSFPGVLTGSNGRLYITTAPAFSGPVSDNLAATASYSTMGQLISNAVTAGQVNPAMGRVLMQTWSEAEFGVANDYLVRAGLEAFAAQVRSVPDQQLAPEAAKTLRDHARAVWTFAGLEGEM